MGAVIEPNTIVPLYNHSPMTYALKIGCRDVYRINRWAMGREERKLGMTCTSQMDEGILKACVGFLTHDKLDYFSLVDRPAPRKWYTPKTSTRTHDNAIMALRFEIAKYQHVPYDEEKIHFWSDFALLYQHLDDTDRLQVDAFFELLMGKSFKALFDEHAIKSLSAFEPQQGHAYQACEHLETLVRSDVARHQFSITIGSETLDQKIEICQDGEEYWNDVYDFDYHNPGPKVTPPEYKHPALEDFDFYNPGAPYAELRDCIMAAFERQTDKGYRRHITIRFRNAEILRGKLTHSGFIPENIYPQQGLGLCLTRQNVLDALSECQKASRVRVKFDDMFGADLGL
ncbi:hypothetical protein IFT69_18220 [Pseudomonas putida]|nr:hypothetical protein [Pseudomonas putida]